MVIITTPEEPLTPYIAVAVASFNMDKSTMSSAFIPEISLVWIPSTTYKGEFSEFIELSPLILTSKLEPGFPEVWTTLIPAALPCIA